MSKTWTQRTEQRILANMKVKTDVADVQSAPNICRYGEPVVKEELELHHALHGLSADQQNKKHVTLRDEAFRSLLGREMDA